MKTLCACVLLGVCALANAVIQTRPQQVHIATDSYSQMTIVWNTYDDTNDSRVFYGTTKNLTYHKTGVRHKFVDGGYQKRYQFIHKVVLTDLKPDTTYYYIVGSEKFGYSDEFSFKTWPAGNNWSPRLAVYGDFGNKNAQSLPRLQVEADRGMYDAILHVGDFAYDFHTDDARVGDEFMRQIEPLAASLPYMTCPGNHESYYNFSNYRNRFAMPGDLNQRMYYSFAMGPVRFISVDTEAIFNIRWYGEEPVKEQYKWLEATLKEANLPENRAKQPWVIIFGHRPMYCSSKDPPLCKNLANPIREGLPKLNISGWEQIMYENKVDIAFWAHEHDYERSWPVYKLKVMNGSYEHPYTNAGAPIHIVTGSAGCQEDHSSFVGTTPDWSAFHTKDYGYTRMNVMNQTHIYFEQVSDDKGGAIVDKLMVIKDKKMLLDNMV